MSPPVALTIAGSDNSAGAGAQADLKTFSALGVYGLTAITCIVAEIPGKVSAIQGIDAELVAEQIRLSFEAFPVAAVKTGLLHDSAIIETVCDALAGRAATLVVDPVMIASSGDRLLREDAVALYKKRLFKQAALVTPNLDEARVLLGREVGTLEQMRDAARELAENYGGAWLLKGGHLRDGQAVDVLFHRAELIEFASPTVRGMQTHGTGCTFSAAITAGLASGNDLRGSIAEAKRFVTRAIERHFRWAGTHALNHNA